MYRSKEIEKYNTYSLPQWKEGNTTYRGEVTYGMHYIFGNSQPYFSITAFTERKTTRKGFNASRCQETVWVEDSCGCLHDLIKKKAPHLAPLIDFHLCDQNGLPMYYLENGYYWYKENLETFKSYVRLADDETIPEVPKIELPTVLDDFGKEHDLPEKEQAKIIESHRKKFITDWLKTREDKLKREFDETMVRFEVEYITQEEIDAIKAE